MEYLLGFFRSTLDQHELTDVALIGVGNLGTAFLNYNFTKNNNIQIKMAFDSDESKVGQDFGGIPVYGIDELSEKLGDIEVVILTVPVAEADPITEKLVASGIKGILNFTPARILFDVAGWRYPLAQRAL